jgi:hypothetical protein
MPKEKSSDFSGSALIRTAPRQSSDCISTELVRFEMHIGRKSTHFSKQWNGGKSASSEVDWTLCHCFMPKEKSSDFSGSALIRTAPRQSSDCISTELVRFEMYLVNGTHFSKQWDGRKSASSEVD